MSDRLLRLFQRFTAGVPLPDAHALPAEWYTDPDWSRLEERAIFARHWINVARRDQLAQPGSFATCQLGSEPLLLTTDEHGVRRALSNVCRHRGACLVTEPEGTVQRLRCRYHGWTYDLAGQLVGAPEMKPPFQAHSCSLPQFPVASWGPLVFTRLMGDVAPSDREPEGALAEALAPLPSMVDEARLNGWAFVGRREYRLACDWKVYVDNYLDGGYHVNTLHRSLAGVLDYSHYVTRVFSRETVSEPSHPPLSHARQRAEKPTQTILQSCPLRPPRDKDDASAARVRVGDHAMYWFIYPNLMLNIYGDLMDTNLVLPDGPGRCRVLFDFYFADPSSTSIDESLAVADRIQDEDAAICEETQRNLQSRHYAPGRYAPREVGVYQFHQWVAESVARERQSGAD